MDRDELLRLINRAAREGRTEPDLSEKRLIEPPMNIGQLTTVDKISSFLPFAHWISEVAGIIGSTGAFRGSL